MLIPPASGIRPSVLPSCIHLRRSPRHRPYYQQRLLPIRNRLRQQCIRRLMRQIFLTCKKSQKRSSLQRSMIANRPLQRWILCLQRIQHSPLRNRPGDVERHLTLDARQRSQMRRQFNPDHASVWTSTERTAGRSRTIGVQLSPESDDPYTCPPVVPKYTPHASSESTDIASRSTFT
jgi:hypothetical protein